MLVLDENLPAGQLLLLHSWRIRFRWIGKEIAFSGARSEDFAIDNRGKPDYFQAGMNSQKNQKAGKNRMRAHGSQGLENSSRAKPKNGHVHVISPATASEIRRTLGIRSTQIANVLRAFHDAGVKV
jgi:hypothetical protein